MTTNSATNGFSSDYSIAFMNDLQVGMRSTNIQPPGKDKGNGIQAGLSGLPGTSILDVWDLRKMSSRLKE